MRHLGMLIRFVAGDLADSRWCTHGSLPAVLEMMHARKSGVAVPAQTGHHLDAGDVKLPVVPGFYILVRGSIEAKLTILQDILLPAPQDEEDGNTCFFLER